MTVITLLTDYGVKDSYVAEMKGAILRICPEVVIVDICHEVRSFDVEEGAYNLLRAVRYFPDGTIHIGVVDPGVGGPRKPLIFDVNNATLIGPDNGLLAPAADRLGVKRVYEITRMDLLPHRVSEVFHGRDIFGPAGALLAKGLTSQDLGQEVTTYERLSLFTAKVGKGSIDSTIIKVDAFGNLVTCITYEDLGAAGIDVGSLLNVRIGGAAYRMPLVRTFSSVPVGELLLLVAGGGYLEISVNQGSASERTAATKGAEVSVSAY